MSSPHPFEPGTRQRLLKRFLDVGRCYGWGQLPRQDMARVVVEHGGQVIPAPALDLLKLVKLVWNS